MVYLFGYLAAINLIAYIVYYTDKQKAIKGKWRISEFTLLSFSVFGGGFGSMLAMRHFRHKTKKKKFTIFVPLITLVIVVVLLYVINEGIIQI